MKSFKEFLKEGLIKIDNNLVKEIADTVFEYALRYIIFKYRNYQEENLRTVLKIIQDSIKEHHLNKYSSGFLYTLSNKFYDKETFEFEFTDIDHNECHLSITTDEDGYASASFDPYHNTIAFNIGVLLRSAMGRICHDPKLIYVINREIIGITKHELTHRTQVAKRFHPYQTKLYNAEREDAKDAYHMSQVEFDPHIKDTIESIKTLKKLYPDEPQIINYFIGANTNLKNVGFPPNRFLETLKRRAPTKYKKALKYIFGYLQNEKV
jgi:hypothetical protein